MAKGYWIVHAEVTDPEQYKGYMALSRPAAEAHGGRFLVRGGAMETPEGQARPRTVLVEFDSYETALKAYWSEDYQAAKAERVGAADFDFVIVEGA